jgi:hypothetical protein
MSKNIVLLSDGTGNSAASIFKTNVWRLFQILDLSDPTRQIAFYDDGVGTSSFKLFAILGGIFGFGLKRNVIALYSFCCRNYKDGDRIYCFGFSRGAFTIRIVAGLIASQGLVTYNDSEADLTRFAADAYRAYRRRFNGGILRYLGYVGIDLRNIRDAAIRAWRRLRGQAVRAPSMTGIESIHFVGINYDPRSAAAKAAEPPPGARTNLMPIDQQRISQVWFTGVHADVGGGYPENGLSFVTLNWMMDRAEAYGLRYLVPQRQLLIDPQIDPTDKLNDSRKGLASYYRYKPRNLRDLYREPPYKPSVLDDAHRIWRLLRKLPDPQTDILADLHPSVPRPVLPPAIPTIHEAVFERIRQGTDRYAPVVIPAPTAYKFTDKNGAVVAGPHPGDPGKPRSSVQDDVWNWIWLRRIVYFLTVGATAFVAFIPFFVIYAPGFGHDTVGSLVNPLINAAASFLPGFLDPWFVAFRNAPGFVLIGAVAIGVLMLFGKNLQETIHDVSRVAWHAPSTHIHLTGWRAAVYRLRRLGIYPACGETYRISLTIKDPWVDKDIPTDPKGFRLGAWRQLGGVPFKRLIWSNWFRPIIRVGSTGLEEHLPTLMQDSADKNLWSGETARFSFM